MTIYDKYEYQDYVMMMNYFHNLWVKTSHLGHDLHITKEGPAMNRNREMWLHEAKQHIKSIHDELEKLIDDLKKEIEEYDKRMKINERYEKENDKQPS